MDPRQGPGANPPAAPEVEIDPHRLTWRRALLPAALFLATFLTTTASGALHAHGGGDVPWWQLLFPVAAIRPISDGLSYSVPLMTILLCHELGHYFTARAHRVHASLPHFIPLPPILGLGTMGAVIGMRRTASDRRQLIDIGAAGPLAGLVVAIPILIYGLSLSPVGPVHPGSLVEGNSILYAALKWGVKGAFLPGGGQDVFLHPTAYAGWAGLLLTMINLLPIGQLDGGHIAVAYFGNRYNRFARGLHRALPLVGMVVFAWVVIVVRGETAGSGRFDMGQATAIALGGAMPWLVWWGMVAAVGRLGGSLDHPPVAARPLPASRRVLFWCMVIVFALLLMPVPMRQTLAGTTAAPDVTSMVVSPASGTPPPMPAAPTTAPTRAPEP